ncbi:MAG: TetR/AcrR family transcriptional regulator [Rhizobiaceae bacterium]|nr:TetR/AcrR family transcriptional regulator [Rhizobiaceae bacterium]
MQMKNSGRRSNTERTRETRATLVKAARKLFVDKGYAETSTPEIVRAAGITRGALYHHFTDKQDLFRAVVEAEFAAVAEEIGKAAISQDKTAIDMLVAGSCIFLDCMLDRGRVRLMLLDGPAVLGADEIGQLDMQTTSRELQVGLSHAMDAGEFRKLPLDALTSQLSAMFDRAALRISEGESREDHLRIFEAVFKALQA